MTDTIPDAIYPTRAQLDQLRESGVVETLLKVWDRKQISLTSNGSRSSSLAFLQTPTPMLKTLKGMYETQEGAEASQSVPKMDKKAIERTVQDWVGSFSPSLRDAESRVALEKLNDILDLKVNIQSVLARSN